MEARAVEAKQVDLRRAGEDPLRELPADASAQHEPHGVKAAGMEEPPDQGLRSHERLMIRGEGLGPTNGGLDAGLFDHRAALHMTCQVLPEGVVIQLEEPEREAGIHIRPELWVLLISSDRHGISLRFEIHTEVVVPHVGKSAVHACDWLGEDHRMFHGFEGYLHACHGRHLVGPRAARIHDGLGFDPPTVGCEDGFDPPRGRRARREVVLNLQAAHADVLIHPSAELARCFRISVADARGIDGPIAWGVDSAVDIIYP
mmetsp:Transcript_56577/g.132185  ORF Transcript_56577/g.132185 Transcript_56577/m.132185 type:complete len:259 (-) Transcript_56577:553-1329(-)